MNRFDGKIWVADRLSTSNREMTYIIAVSNDWATLLAIAPILGTYNDIRVMPSQIYNCLRIRELFRYYKTRHAIFAFRFIAKSDDKYASREQKAPVEYYKIVDGLLKFDSIPLIRCTCDGRTSVMRDGKWYNKNLPNYSMPFNGNKRL